MKKDIEGKEIHIGDKVVFTHNKSEGVKLFIGTVLKEDDTKPNKPLVIRYQYQYKWGLRSEYHEVYITAPSKSIYVIENK